MKKKIGDSIIRIIIGDITKQNTIAIVNAANKKLTPGGGVSGAIHRASGPKLWEECKKLNGCQTGEAKITNGYDLKARYVIHTVGPIYSGSKNDEIKLATCYKNSLKLACEYNISSISFPAISTGIFGYPIKEAALISIKNVINWLEQNDKQILVLFILHDKNTFKIFEHILEEFL